MRRGFYLKLALTNLRKNARLYFPYMLASIGTIMMFYIILFLASNSGLANVIHGGYVGVLLSLGAIIIGIFSAIFLFYTNSFVIKQRTREIGLFNILGMDKPNIAKMVFWETVITSSISIFLGLVFGIAFSKLVYLLLVKIMHFDVSFKFEISSVSVYVTIIYFSIIFIATLLSNLARISLAKPTELIRADKTGEKEPKTKKAVAIIGVLTLGAGYYMALRVDNPLDAFMLFFVAVILVIIGTYCLFTAGSIALLKALRKNKRYYYKLKHFISVSGMIYRMKQNAVGLGNICILSTMVLVMISTTLSMYLGYEDAIRRQCPRNIEIMSATLDNISKQDADILYDIVCDKLEAENIDTLNMLNYRYTYLNVKRNGDTFTFYDHDNSGSEENIYVLYFMTLEDYNHLNGSNVALSENEVIFYSAENSYQYESLRLGAEEYSIKLMPSSFNIEERSIGSYADLLYVVMADETAIENVYNMIAQGITPYTGLRLYIGFDLDMPIEDQDYIGQMIEQTITNAEGGRFDNVYVRIAAYISEDFFSMYGGLYFLAIFLGLVFIMAAVLIIYYKQVSEGYEDKKKFEIMQNVGMSKKEVKAAIRSQILTVFFLPLITSVIHVIVAFQMISQLVGVLGITNIKLMFMCTLGTVILFVVLYSAVYALTAKAYYRIVGNV